MIDKIWGILNSITEKIGTNIYMFLRLITQQRNVYYIINLPLLYMYINNKNSEKPNIEN